MCTLVQWVKGMEYVLGMSQDCPGINVLGFSGRGYAGMRERESHGKPTPHLRLYWHPRCYLSGIFWLQITETQLNWPNKKWKSLGTGHGKHSRSSLNLSPPLSSAFLCLLQSQAACPCVVAEVASYSSRLMSHQLITPCPTG